MKTTIAKLDWNGSTYRHFSPAEGEVASYFSPQKPKVSRNRLFSKWLRFLFSIFCVLIVIKSEAQSIEELSLAAFLEMASRQNIAGQQAQSDLQQAEWQYKWYKASLKPRLTASANFPNYAKTFREITQPDGTILFQPVTNNNSTFGLSLVQNIPTGGVVYLQSGLQRFDNFEGKEKLFNGNPIQIGLSQPVFGFNALKWDKKIEPLKRSEAKKRFSADMLEIQSRATTLFFDLLVAHQEASIAQKNEENNQQLFSIAEERLTLGRISRGDLKQLELELISAKQARQRAEQAVYYASAAINDFLGRPYSEEAIVPVFPKGDTKEPVDPTIVLQKAMANNPDLITQQRMLLEVNRDLERAKRDNGPQVNINASFGLVRSSPDFSDVYKDPKQEQFAQVQFTIPIVDWGARKSAVGIAQTQRDFTERSIQQQKLTFKTIVLQTAEEVNFLIQDLQMAESVEQIALERFEIAKESYVLGAISITELTLAQRENDQAQRQYTRTVREYWQARGRLRTLVNE